MENRGRNWWAWRGFDEDGGECRSKRDEEGFLGQSSCGGGGGGGGGWAGGGERETGGGEGERGGKSGDGEWCVDKRRWLVSMPDEKAADRPDSRKGVHGEVEGKGKGRGNGDGVCAGRRRIEARGVWKVTLVEGVLILLLLGLALRADASPANDLKANAEWVTSHIWNRSGNETVAPPGSLYIVMGNSYPTTENGSEIVFANFTATGTNVGAGMEVDEPSHGSLETRASVWWMWESPVNATMRVTTAGSSPCDTSIAVYVPAPWDGIRVTNAFGVHAVSRGLRMDDEEFNVPGKLHSTAYFTAEAGQFYYIAVGGFRGSNCTFINLVGSVDSYILPPPFIPRVLDVTFSVAGTFGTVRNASEPLHDQYSTVSMACETPGAYIFYTRDLSAPNVRMLMSGKFLEDPIGGSTIPWLGEPIPMDNVVIRAQAFKKGMLDSYLTTSSSFRLQSYPTRIFPDGGQFNISVLVTIYTECEDEPVFVDSSALRGPGDACVVHYTTDGSEPDLSSTRYTIPFPLVDATDVVVKSRLYNARMIPSPVTISQPFNVWNQASVPTFSPPGTSCGLGELDDCPGHVIYDYSVTVHIETSTPGADIFYNLDLVLTPSSEWTQYLGGGITFYPGVHRLRAVARKERWMESEETVRQYQVYQNITAIDLGEQVQGIISPGEYQYYTTRIWNVRTDILVTINRFFGLTDIFLSAYTMRIVESNLTQVYSSRAASGEGLKLQVLHSEFDFDVDEVNGTPIYIAVLGVGVFPTQFLFEVEAETSPVVQLGMLYSGQVAYREWTYFKFYMGEGSPGEEPLRSAGMRIEVRQELSIAIGIRVSFLEGGHPTDANVGETVTRGTDEGVFELPVSISQQKATYYIGVRGLFAIAPEFNFTFSISPYPEPPMLLHSPLPRGLGPPCSRDEDFGVEGGCTALEIFPGVTYLGSVRSTRFSFFRIRPTLAGQSVVVTVTEGGAAGGVYTGGLQVLIQQDVLPTLVAHMETEYSTTDPMAGTYAIRADIGPGHSYVIGVYANSYMQREFNFTLQTTIFTLPSTFRPGGRVPQISPITNNYRFFYKTMTQDTYAFYLVDLPSLKDLTIQLALALGNVDMYVSNTNPYPTASREGVSWMSLADEGLNQINIYSSDADYKLGVYFIGLYCRDYCDFGLTAYLDKSSTSINLGSKYGILASTFSYRYFRTRVDKQYADISFNVQTDPGPQMMVVLVQYGRRPTQNDYLFLSYTIDENGLITYNIVSPSLGDYFIMIHFYPPGYSGAVLSHRYTISVKVDDFEPPGYRQYPNIPYRDTFVVSHDKYYAAEGYPVPEPWDLTRPVGELGVPPTISLGRATLFSFSGSEWVYARFLVDSFRVSFTVHAQALSPDLEMVVGVMKSFKPTLAMYLGQDDVPDAADTYSVKIDYPVTGAYYYIGLYSPRRTLTVSTAISGRAAVGADVSMWIETEVGQETFPLKYKLKSYFVQFNLLQGLTYAFYTIDVPADGRDISITVTRLNPEARTDIVVSNVEEYPTNGKFSPDKLGKGWWRSEDASGDGVSVIIRNFHPGYKSPGKYNIAVFAISRTNYFILVRLDRPPPTIQVSRIARGQVAASAFTNFRFVPGLPVASKMYVVIKQAPPHIRGLRIYLKQDNVPTLTDYDSVSDVSDYIGNYVVAIDQPQPDSLIYVGVFGVDLDLIAFGDNYYFSIEVMSDQAFKNYVPAAYVGYTNVGAISPNAPPPSWEYSPLQPEVLVAGTLARNATAYYRVQISENTVVNVLTADSGNSSSYLSLYAREIKLPYPGATGIEGDANSVSNGEFVYKVCAPLENSSGINTTLSPTGPKLGTPGSVGECGRWSNLSLSFKPEDLADGFVFIYLAVHFPGCANRTDACPANATFTIMASRSARTAPPILLGQLGKATTQVYTGRRLQFPSLSLMRYVTPVESNMSYYFSLQVTQGQVDMFASAASSFPNAGDNLLPRHQSLDAFNNPPIAFHPDQKPTSSPNVPVYLAISTPSRAGAVYSLTYRALPAAGRLFLSRPVNGKVSSPVFSHIFSGWARAYFRVTPESFAWKGWNAWSETKLVVRPTNPVCDGKPCVTKACCKGKNPFGYFDIVTQRGTAPSTSSPTSGFLPSPMTWMAGPNSDCVKRSNCTADVAAGSAPNQHCEGQCEAMPGQGGQSCCEQFTTYSIYFAHDEVREFTETLYVAVQGREAIKDRKTDTFEIELSPVTPEVGQDVSADADERFTAVTRVGGDPVDGGGERIRVLTPGVDQEDAVGWGEWRLFEWTPQASGTLHVTVTQDVGEFGLRVIASKDSRPATLRDKDTASETCSTADAGNCSLSDTADVQTSQDGWAVHSSKQGGGGGDPTLGSNATFAIRVTASKRVTVAVFGSSPVYAPYSFTLSAIFSKTIYSAQEYLCKDVNLTGSLAGRLGTGGYHMVQTPLVPGDFDIFVTASPEMDATHGRCAGGGFGGNQTVDCYLQMTPEVWTGNGGRVRNSSCEGCWSEAGWDYPGGVLSHNWPFAYFGTRAVTVKRCFLDFVWTRYTDIIFSTKAPFITLNQTAPPDGAVCEDITVQATETKSELRPLPNYVASSEQECCDRCQQEPTCSYWTLRSELCWRCFDTNLPIDSITVAPAQAVDFLDYSNTSWIGDVGLKLVTGPRCNQSVEMCCTMRNHSVAEKNKARTKTSSDTTSGSVGLCRPTANGHVGLLLSHSLPCEQVTNANRGAEIPFEGEGLAEQNEYDARQYWLIDGRESLCTETWDGRQVFGDIFTPPGDHVTCHRSSNSTIKLATPDELGMTKCVGVKIDAWQFIGGQATQTWQGPYNFSNLSVTLNDCPVQVFRTATNKSDPNATEVFLPLNESSIIKIHLNEWDLHDDGTLRLRHSLDSCLAFGYTERPHHNITWYDGIVKLKTHPGLASCNYSRAHKQVWSFEPGGSIRFTWHGKVMGCLSAFTNCSRYGYLWNDYCTLAQNVSQVSLMPCEPAKPPSMPVVAASSHPSFVPKKRYVISAHGILPSSYNLSWAIKRGYAKIVPGGLYGAVLTEDSANASIELGSGTCFRLYHDTTQDGYTAHVHQRGPRALPLRVTSRRGLCSLPAENTAPKPHGLESGRPYALNFRTDAFGVDAFNGSPDRDVTCICVSAQMMPPPPADSWPVHVTLQVWPQENVPAEPTSSLPPWAADQDANVDDGWLAPGENVELALTIGENASWLMYVREALVVTAAVENGTGVSVDLFVGNQEGYTPWGGGGQSLYVYAEDGPLLTVWLAANFSDAGNTSSIKVVVSVTTAARAGTGDTNNSSMPRLSVGEGDFASVLVAERVGARRSSYLTLEAPLGYTTILSVLGHEGEADVIVVPAGGALPSRAAPRDDALRSDAINSYPDIVLEGREEGYVVGVFADLRSNLTLGTARLAIAEEMRYGSVMRILIQPGETRLFRFPHNVLASPSVLFSLKQTSPLPLNATECPVALAVRDDLPPTASVPGLVSSSYEAPIDLLVRSLYAKSFVLAISRCFPAHMGHACHPIAGGPCGEGGSWGVVNCTAGAPQEAPGGSCEFELLVTTPSP